MVGVLSADSGGGLYGVLLESSEAKKAQCFTRVTLSIAG